MLSVNSSEPTLQYAPRTQMAFKRFVASPQAPSPMCTLYLVPMRTHACDSWEFQVDIKSKGEQSRSMRRRTPCSAYADCCGVAAMGFAGKRWEASLSISGWKEGHSWPEGWQELLKCTKESMPGWWWGLAVRLIAIIAAWNLIKVQMPREEFLQKNSTVTATYQSCLGNSFSKCSLLHNEEIGNLIE